MSTPEFKQITTTCGLFEYTVSFEGRQPLCIQSHLLGTVQWRFGQPQDLLDEEIVAEALRTMDWLGTAVPTKKIVHLRRVDAYDFEHNTDGQGWQKVLGYVHDFRESVHRAGMHLIETA